MSSWLSIANLVRPPAEDSVTSPDIEENLQAFYAALVQFRVQVQTFTRYAPLQRSEYRFGGMALTNLCSSSEEDTSRLIRSIIDQCAQTALENYRVLPRMWFERPFLLEEESQLERFLASTQIITPYAAQSLLHKISIADLFNSRYGLSCESFEPLRSIPTDTEFPTSASSTWSSWSKTLSPETSCCCSGGACMLLRGC